MSTVLDYRGRTVDLLAFQGASTDGERLLTHTLAAEGESGQITSGIQKLAQRWLVEFLTVRGSLNYLPSRGSSFMAYARTGVLRTTIEAEQAFALASSEVAENLRREEEENTPDDETFAFAELLSITIIGDRLVVHVNIVSEAGSSREVLLPIDVTIAE